MFQDQCKKWRIAIKRRGNKNSIWSPTENSVVCHDHFRAEDFKDDSPFVSRDFSGRAKKRLKPGVVPSIFNLVPSGSEPSARSLSQRARMRKPANQAAEVSEVVISELSAPEVLEVDITTDGDPQNTKFKTNKMKKMNNKECQSQVNDLFTKLNNWKVQSQREFSNVLLDTFAQFSNIIDYQSAEIGQGIGSLVEEIDDLKAQLSIMTQERNDLRETVQDLSGRCVQSEENVNKSGHSEDTNDTAESENGIEIETSMDTSDLCQGYQDDNDTKLDPESQKLPTDEVETEGNEDTRNDEFVQFEDKQGNIKTTLNRSGNKGSRKHACGSCPYTSTSRSHLKEHVENIHEKIKRHFCKECQYASYHKGDLTHHVRKLHEKSINVCEDCGYAVERKALLNSHRASVHGIRN